jgi:hypothetical protein
MLQVPAPTVENIPVPTPIEATPGQAQLQVPPPGELVYVVVEPAHKFMVPPIADGAPFTMATAVTIQPVPKE